MLDPFILLVDLLAVYRLTRLIVKDSLLQEVRWWILRRWPSALTEYPDNIVNRNGHVLIGDSQVANGNIVDSGVQVYQSNKTDEDGDPIWLPVVTHKWTEIIECVYCCSIYVAFAVLGLRVWWDWWQYPALATALAGGVALIFSRLDTE